MAATDRATLSRELIADTALRIIDSDGLGGLSMRKLGSALGVEAMSLYHYIENKSDLLDAVVDNLYGEIDLPTDVPDNDWEPAFRQGLRSFHDVLLKHPAALELFTTRPSSSANALAVMGWAFDRCRMAGLNAREAAETFHFCVAWVLGHVASELGMMARVDAGEPTVLSNGAAVDPDFAAFLEYNTGSRSELFEVGLDLLFSSLASSFGLSRQ